MDSGDTAWILASSALVMLMTPGLAFFYGGLVRGKNVLGTIMHSFVAIALVSVVWVLWGYSLAFGPDVGGVIGNLDYVGLRNVSPLNPDPHGYASTIPHQTFMVFQLMFAIITPALVSGAFAERMKFSSFVIFHRSLVYDRLFAPLAHWVWGTGWVAGTKRLGRYGLCGRHSSSHQLGGRRTGGSSCFWETATVWVGAHGTSQHPICSARSAALLWFGWFGFNAGSALASGGSATSAFVATNTAAATAALTWLALSWQFTGKVSVVGAATGAVAGLATITPAAGFVGPMPAIVIGLGAGTFCYLAIWFKNKVRLDDSLDVWGVHCIGSTWGMLATGLFVGVGLVGFGYSDFALEGINRGEQILRQLGAIGVAWGWAFSMTLVILFALKFTLGLRVKEEEEEQGLDLSQHGEEAYGR